MSSSNETKSRGRNLFAAVIWHLCSLLAIIAIAYGAYSYLNYGTETHKGAKVYYDAVHCGRHIWNRANERYRSNYHTVSGFHRFHKDLKKEGYKVHVETYNDLTRNALDEYDVYFIGEQTYHSRFMTDAEQKLLLEWVKDGGGLFATIEHTNVHYMGQLFNKLFKDLPVKVRYDSIGDMDQPGPVSPTWIELPIIKEHPVTEGVKEYRFYNGGSLDTPHGVLFSSETSWSDNYNQEKTPIHNGNKMQDADELTGPLAGAAAFEYGKGRIVIVSDHNAMTNPTLYWGDHHKFIFNSIKWLAQTHFNLDITVGIVGIAVLLALVVIRFKCKFNLSTTVTSLVLSGLIILAPSIGWLLTHREHHFLVHTANDSAMNYSTKKGEGFFAFYGQLTKEPQLYPWASKEIKAGHNALFLSAPMQRYSDEQLKIIDDYLQRGKSVVYLATVTSLESDAGKQLKEKFQFKVDITKDPELRSERAPLTVHGDGKWTRGVLRCYVYSGIDFVRVKGLRSLVHLTDGTFHIPTKYSPDRKVLSDVISEKQVRNGKFIMVAPVEIFTDRALKSLWENSDVIREQMAELIIRLAKYSSGDNSVSKDNPQK